MTDESSSRAVATPRTEEIPTLAEVAQGLPLELRSQFERCWRAVAPAGSELLARVRDHLEAIRLAARSNETLAVDIAEDIASGLLSLLRGAGDLSGDHRALVEGAARYFIASDDARPDLGGPLGLDDDAAVFNAVVAHIGRGDLEVEL